MFWKYNSNRNSSEEMDSLLEQEDVTLSEVMDSEDTLSLCKIQHKALVDFILKTENMEQLIGLITREPSADIEESIRFKYPNIACELLTSDVPAIYERLASNEVLLDKLYGFLESEPPLNPLLASYFSRTMGALITKKTDQVLDFLKAKDTFISLLLKHLGTSAIMDLMLKLLTQIESVEMKQNILNWLDSQRIMQSLVSILNPKIDPERHYNVAQLLSDFVRVARDSQNNALERVDPDPLLNTLESSETVSLLLSNILATEQTESAIISGIKVLFALLDVDQQTIPKLDSQIPYNSNINDEAVDIEHKERVIKSIIDSLILHVKDFHQLLLEPPKKNPLMTTVGLLEVPLGNTRLQVIKLFAVTITIKNPQLHQEIISLDTISVIVDLLFKYPWNNFLHTQVEKCLIGALKIHSSEESNENSNALSRYILVHCNVIDRLLKAWKDNDEKQKEKNLRQGYMGHLISIINKIVDLCSNTPLGKFLDHNMPEVAKSLQEFQNTTLRETNAIQDTLLGGVYPNSSNEENDDYSDPAFPQDQMYSSYQAQHLTSNSIDGYSGFNDDAFNDGDDTLQSIDHRTDMNFGLSDNELAQQHDLFKQICSQRISTLDDADDQIFEEREHTFQTVIEKGDPINATYSSDSDEESASGAPMDVDPWTSPKVTDTDDPWGGGNQTSKGGDMGDWADFSSMSFEPSFERKETVKEKINNSIETIAQSLVEHDASTDIKSDGGHVEAAGEDVAAVSEPSKALSLEGLRCPVESTETPPPEKPVV